jgi:hypothetical protein
MSSVLLPSEQGFKDKKSIKTDNMIVTPFIRLTKLIKRHLLPVYFSDLFLGLCKIKRVVYC